MSEQLNTPAERLKIERQRLGLSQEEFACLGGVKKRSQINYEKGERKPDAAYFEGIAAAGANVSYILTGKTEEERQAALEDRMDAIKECTQRALLLTSDQQKGELVRDVLLGDRWNKPEIIDAAIERYVAVRQVRHKGTKD